LKYLQHKEVIIHPVCHFIQSDSILKLAECNKKLSEMFYNNGITVCIENNSKLDPINYLPNELKIIFHSSPETELLLDVAHIDSYQHLQKIIDIRFPRCLHLADKHFSVIHEHLPIGQGDLDFNQIFNYYLKGYDGKVIFEVVTDVDDDIIKSKEIVQNIFNQL
jgi:sugar phosphate isomerase/epimerase